MFGACSAAPSDRKHNELMQLWGLKHTLILLVVSCVVWNSCVKQARVTVANRCYDSWQRILFVFLFILVHQYLQSRNVQENVQSCQTKKRLYSTTGTEVTKKKKQPCTKQLWKRVLNLGLLKRPIKTTSNLDFHWKDRLLVLKSPDRLL